MRIEDARTARQPGSGPQPALPPLDIRGKSICNGLLSSAGYNPQDEKPLYTVGSNAHRVERVVPVKALMDELRGAATESRARAFGCAARA
jgi:hypothetical protein